MSTPPLPTIQRMPTGSLVLCLPLDAYAIAPTDTVQVGPHVLHRKNELHVTLFNAATLAALDTSLGGDAILREAERYRWQPVRSGDASLIVEVDRERYSLVEWITLDGFDALRDALAQAAGIPIPRTLPHITQYVSEGDGIGLPDMSTIARMRVADLRLPGVATRRPTESAASVRRSYADGRSLLPPDVEVRLGEPDPAIATWLERHGARVAWIVSAADPFGEQADKRGNAVRWGLLEAALNRADVRSVATPGQDDDDEPVRISLCLLDADVEAIDAFLRDYEQLAAVCVPARAAPFLHLHPTLRTENHP